MNPSDAELYNPARLDELTEGDRAFISELLITFRQDLFEQLQQLKSLAPQETAKRKQLAHGMRGACRNVGAEPLAALFHLIELNAERDLIDWETIESVAQRTWNMMEPHVTL